MTMVREHGFATIEVLAEHFAVSAQTIRRDIIDLDARGLLQRFHGGAGARDPVVRLGYADKQVVAAGSKAQIAACLAGQIPDGASLFLDVGTTAEAVAKALLLKRRLRVVTPNLAAATILSSRGSAEVFVTGGIVHGADGSLVGDTAVREIERFQVDHAIIGCSGFGPAGEPMDFDPFKVAVKQAMIAHARDVSIAADASKMERTAILRICAPQSRMRIVTDRQPPAKLAKAWRKAGVPVLIA
jgi:DeoR family glycerol-3-phosphate regulon repressor